MLAPRETITKLFERAINSRGDEVVKKRLIASSRFWPHVAVCRQFCRGAVWPGLAQFGAVWRGFGAVWRGLGAVFCGKTRFGSGFGLLARIFSGHVPAVCQELPAACP